MTGWAWGGGTGLIPGAEGQWWAEPWMPAPNEPWAPFPTATLAPVKTHPPPLPEPWDTPGDGSQWRWSCPHPKPGDISGHHNQDGAAGIWWAEAPGMLLSTVQCSGSPHHKERSASSDWEMLSLSEWTWRENTLNKVAAQTLQINYSGSRWNRAQHLLGKRRVLEAPGRTGQVRQCL